MTPGSTLVPILISIAIGFLVGALVYGLRSRPAQAGEADSPEEGVRVWRDPLTQNLAIEVEGRTYQEAGELTPRMRSELAQLAREWQLWLGMPLARLAALSAESGEARPGEVLDPGAASAASGPATGAGMASVGTATSGPAPDRMRPTASPGARTQDLAGPQSIAGQIDEILQARLQNTPLAARGIQLVELPGQGLVVKVGPAQYTDLTQVPDEEARAAIAGAVAEWERRNAPQGGTR